MIRYLIFVVLFVFASEVKTQDISRLTKEDKYLVSSVYYDSTFNRLYYSEHYVENFSRVRLKYYDITKKEFMQLVEIDTTYILKPIHTDNDTVWAYFENINKMILRICNNNGHIETTIYELSDDFDESLIYNDDRVFVLKDNNIVSQNLFANTTQSTEISIDDGNIYDYWISNTKKSLFVLFSENHELKILENSLDNYRIKNVEKIELDSHLKSSLVDYEIKYICDNKVFIYNNHDNDFSIAYIFDYETMKSIKTDIGIGSVFDIENISGLQSLAFVIKYHSELIEQHTFKQENKFLHIETDVNADIFLIKSNCNNP